MNLTNFSLKRPVTTLMIVLSFTVLGFIAFKMLPMEYFPAIDIPFVVIYTPYPGSTPEEVENEVTRPLEEALAMISGVKSMESTSSQNASQIFMMFEWGDNINVKALEAREKIEAVRKLLPNDVERFIVFKFNTTDMPILQIRLSSNRDLTNSYDMLDRVIKRKIDRIDGVAKVDLYGISKKEIEIKVKPDKLITHNIDINRMTQILRASDFSISSGKIEYGSKEIMIRSISEIATIDDLKNIVIGGGEALIRLKDVADITYTTPKLDYGRHLDGKYAIGLEVQKSSDANTIGVTKKILDTIDEIKKSPEMEGIKVFVMDNQAEGISSSITELFKSGLIGAFLASLVLFFFLRNIANTVIVVISVPISILSAGVFMYFFDISLNILSMMGLLLAVGMLVDNAVVAMESIFRYQKQDENKDENPDKIILKGVKRIALAITAGTLTTIIVFLPNIINQKNQISIFLSFVGIPLVISLVTSLLISLTIVPLLTKMVTNKKKLKDERLSEEELFLVESKRIKKENKKTIIDSWAKFYGKILKWKLDHHKTSVFIMFALLFSMAIPASFVNQDEENQSERKIYLQYNINSTYDVDKVLEAVDIIEEYLFNNKEKFEIKSVYSYYNTNYAYSAIVLKSDDDVDKAQEEIIEEIKQGLPKIAVGKASFDRGRNNNSTNDDNISINLHGKSSQTLFKIADDVVWRLSKIKGFEEVKSDAKSGDDEVFVIIDRDKAKKYGFTTMQIASVISTSYRGVSLNSFKTDNGEVDISLKFSDEEDQNLSQLKDIPIVNNQGKIFKLNSLARFEKGKGPGQIRRMNRVTSSKVSIFLRGVTLDESKKLINAALKEFDFPPGYGYSFGANFDYRDEQNEVMMINLLLALALIYFVMAALFESFILPVSIWSSIIFAIVGVYWFFLFTGTSFSLMAMIGVLVLIGVVVNNGIVLIEHVNNLVVNEGMDRKEAILVSGQERLRPILMTAATTVLSMLPLCIVKTQVGGDGPAYFPMARAIVGGLTFSTVITLLILPTIYIMLDDLRNWGEKMFRKAMR